MRLLVNDPFQNQAAIELGAEYVDLDTLFRESDVFRGKSTPQYNSILSAMDDMNFMLQGFSTRFGDYPFKMKNMDTMMACWVQGYGASNHVGNGYISFNE